MSMTKKDFTAVGGAIYRTAIINALDKNSVRRKAKNDALYLLISDLIGTLSHEYPQKFDEDKFKRSCGL